MIDLETERMILRRCTVEDEDLLVELDSDPDVMLVFSGGIPTPREKIRDEILPRFMRYHEDYPGYGAWLAIEKATGMFLGLFLLAARKGRAPDPPELGYRLRKAAWGQGFATEGSRALVDRAFAEFGARRVVAEAMAIDAASRRVLEKAGLRFVRSFHQELPFRVPGDEQGDVEYALTREAWEEERGARAAGADGASPPNAAP